MEAMIRHENDGGIFAGFLQQSPQHPIVELVRHRDHVVVQFEVAFPDPGLPRRMVLHEAVAEVIVRVEVDREEIPRAGCPPATSQRNACSYIPPASACTLPGACHCPGRSPSPGE